jgi:tRNA wybutosine-synthesizing protein 1
MLKIPEKLEKLYRRQGYRIVGKQKHSAVKICQWTKSVLRGGEPCFKQKWYGIQSHRCLQCTSWLSCLNDCLYCWRSFKIPISLKKVDEPSELIDEMIKAQRTLLSGFKGNKKTERKKWEEAQNPNNVALSLIGESLLYPRISELLREFHERGFTSFLVTKGTLPEKLASLEEEPTNLYISLSSPDEETQKFLERPLIKNAWKKQLESLKLMNSFSCRKVIRLTLVKGFNMEKQENYAKLILMAEPDFVEVKAYMWVGESRNRLPGSTMPSMDDVRNFAETLSKLIGYKVKDDNILSRVVLLSKK